MFFEKEAVKIRKGQANCPHCGTTLTPRDRGLPLRYSGASLIRVLILTVACGMLLWLFANPMELLPLIGGLRESVRNVAAAVLCVTIGFLFSYLLEMVEIKLLYRAAKQKIYGFYCPKCRKAYIGVKAAED